MHCMFYVLELLLEQLMYMAILDGNVRMHLSVDLWPQCNNLTQ